MKGIILSSLVLLISLNSCGLKEKLEKQNRARMNADLIMESLNKKNIVEQFPEKYFPRNQLTPILESLSKNCDLDSKRGKFVDFYTMMNNGKNHGAFIYEYFLKCDSLRFIYVYDLDSKEPELYKFNIESIEHKNAMIIDPRKQLLYRKDE